MAHGTHCHCMMCMVGKKMGMIRKDEQHHDHNEHGHDSNHETCEHCGHTHNKDARHDCGCK